MVFDALYATSQRNDALTPRPYDSARDGLVVGEGAGMLVLEALSHARAHPRGTDRLRLQFRWHPHYWPEAATMRIAMEQALADALPASAIGYVNGHGTATEHGTSLKRPPMRCSATAS